MKAKSKASKMQQGKDFTMLNPINASQLDPPVFAIVESVQPNSETILPDRLNLCESGIQNPRSVSYTHLTLPTKA